MPHPARPREVGSPPPLPWGGVNYLTVVDQVWHGVGEARWGAGSCKRASRRTGGTTMPTPRKPTRPTTEAIDQFCARFDDLLPRYEERTALRQYLIGLLLPREHNKTLVELGAIVPGAERQRLHHFLHDAPWDAQALNRRRLAQWQAHPYLGPHSQGVLIVDETGDPKRGQRIVLAAQQYLGKRGHVANGGVAGTSHWADGSRHRPLGVKPHRQATRRPAGRADPRLHPNPELAWEVLAEARAAGIPLRLGVADAVYGDSAPPEAPR